MMFFTLLHLRIFLPSKDWLSPLLLDEATQLVNISSANLGSGFIPCLIKKEDGSSPFMWNTGLDKQKVSA